MLFPLFHCLILGDGEDLERGQSGTGIMMSGKWAKNIIEMASWVTMLVEEY